MHEMLNTLGDRMHAGVVLLLNHLSQHIPLLLPVLLAQVVREQEASLRSILEVKFISGLKFTTLK